MTSDQHLARRRAVWAALSERPQPSFRELMARVGCRSYSDIQHDVEALVRLGYLARNGGRSRALIVRVPFVAQGGRP